jgi:hypothetical protein
VQFDLGVRDRRQLRRRQADFEFDHRLRRVEAEIGQRRMLTKATSASAMVAAMPCFTSSRAVR